MFLSSMIVWMSGVALAGPLSDCDGRTTATVELAEVVWTCPDGWVRYRKHARTMSAEQILHGTIRWLSWFENEKVKPLEPAAGVNRVAFLGTTVEGWLEPVAGPQTPTVVVCRGPATRCGPALDQLVETPPRLPAFTGGRTSFSFLGVDGKVALGCQLDVASDHGVAVFCPDGMLSWHRTDLPRSGMFEVKVDQLAEKYAVTLKDRACTLAGVAATCRVGAGAGMYLVEGIATVAGHQTRLVCHWPGTTSEVHPVCAPILEFDGR